MSSDSDILPQHTILPPGEEFGDFEIQRLLGHGLLGVIYSVVHMDTNEASALCVLPYRASMDLRFGARIRSYVQDSESFDHPGFPKIKGCTVIRGRFCIEMSEIRGTSLETLYVEKCERIVDAHPGFSWQQTQRIVRGDIDLPEVHCFDEATVLVVLKQLSEMLSVVHRQRSALLCLSPSYIFIDETLNVQVALGGFLASIGTPLFQAIVSAEVNPVCGGESRRCISVIDIMSPEMQLGSETHVKTDLFASGILAYWMLTGYLYSVLPVEAKVSDFRPSISGAWGPIIDALVEPNVESRMASPQVLQSMLLEIKGQHADEGGVGDPEAEKKNRKKKRQESKQRSDREADRKLSAGAKAPSDSTQSKKSLLTLLLATVMAGAGYFAFTFFFSQPEPEPVVAAPVIKKMGFIVEGLEGMSVQIVDPEGESVDLGTVGASGELSSAPDAFNAGRYRLVAKHPDYAAFESALIQFQGDRLHRVKPPLRPLPGSLAVTTQPEGAHVFLDGEQMGESPVTLQEIPAGAEVVVQVLKAGYREQAQRATLGPNEAAQLTFSQLEPEEARLVVDIALIGSRDLADLAAAAVRLVGADRDFDPGEAISVTPGEIEVRATHPDYWPGSGTVTLADRDSSRIELRLEPRNGLVVLAGQIPARFELMLDGARVEPRRLTSGELVLSIEPRRDYAVRLTAPDFLPFEETLRVSPNRQITIEVSLQRVPGPEIGNAWSLPYLGSDFIWVPGGSYQRGSPLDEHARLPNEGPDAQVSVEAGFWVAASELTQDVYTSVMGDNPSDVKGPSLPVNAVSWNEADAFCRRLTESERKAGRLPAGYVYRLPTETEWEYFARAGQRAPFAWGDVADGSEGNFSGVYPRGHRSDNLVSQSSEYGLRTVMSFEPNAWGIYDVHGNVREWTLNRYRPRLDLPAEYEIPEDAWTRERTQRGGGWEDFAPRVRFAARERVAEHVRSSSAGFRVILAPELTD